MASAALTFLLCLPVPARASHMAAWKPALVPSVQAAGASAGPGSPLAALSRLAFESPGTEHNLTRLEPLVSAMPVGVTPEAFAALPPARQAEVLAEAARLAGARTDAYVERTLKGLDADKVPDARLAAIYDRLEHVFLLEGEYLSARNRERLEARLPLLREEVRLHALEQSVKTRRRMEQIARELRYRPEEQTVVDGAEGGVADKNGPGYAPWNDAEGYDGEPLYMRFDREEERLRAEFLADRSPEAAQMARYPLSGAELRYGERLEKAAREGQAADFWTMVRYSYDHVATRLDDAVFPEVRKGVRLGPWARALLPALRRQAERMRDRFRESYAPHAGEDGWERGRFYGDYADRRKGVDSIEGGYARIVGLIDRLEERMIADEVSARNDAAWHSKQLLGSLGGYDSARAMSHLFAVVDYYRRLVSGARASGDPGLMPETVALVEEGQEPFRGFFVLNKDSLIAAARQLAWGGIAGRLRAWGAALMLASLAPWALVAGFGAFSIPYLAAAAAASVLIGLFAWLGYLRPAARLEGVGAELSGLFRGR